MASFDTFSDLCSLTVKDVQLVFPDSVLLLKN